MSLMQNISHDLMFLIGDLHERKIPRLLGELAGLQGGTMPSLSEQERAAVRFIKLLNARLKLGNYRIAEPEIPQLRDVTAWAMAKMHQIKKTKAARAGQALREKEPVLHWSGNDGPRQTLPAGTYSAVLVAIHDGTLDTAVNQGR